MTKPLSRMTVTTEDGRWSIFVRCKRRPPGWYVKVTDRDGDALAEMRVAASVGQLLQASVSAAAGRPIGVIVGPMRHIADHEPAP